MPCSKCGCKLFPCRCDFDNEADFFKYGEAFFELEVMSTDPWTKEALNKTFKKIDGWSNHPARPRLYLSEKMSKELLDDLLACTAQPTPKKNLLRRLLAPLKKKFRAWLSRFSRAI